MTRLGNLMSDSTGQAFGAYFMTEQEQTAAFCSVRVPELVFVRPDLGLRAAVTGNSGTRQISRLSSVIEVLSGARSALQEAHTSYVS
jgi:hypothetical protein